jgi:hypothetical protein
VVGSVVGRKDVSILRAREGTGGTAGWVGRCERRTEEGESGVKGLICGKMRGGSRKLGLPMWGRLLSGSAQALGHYVSYHHRHWS